MEIIEQIGSYAGLAAVVGLAVLAALYFSQARDVRRLRELEQAREAGAAQAQSQGPMRPTAARVPGPAPAAPAAKSPAPPAGQAAPVGNSPSPQPSAAAAQASTPSRGASPAATQVHPPPAPVGTQGGAGEQERREAGHQDERQAKPATAAAAAGTPAPTAGPAEAGPEAATTGATPKPAEPAKSGDRPPPRLPTPRPGATLRGSAPPTLVSSGGRGRLAPRYVALVLAGILVLGAGAAYAVAALVGDDGATPTTADDDGRGAAGEGQQPFDPSTIEVAVLNGTEVPGLAGQISDTVESAGFQRGNVANATAQGATAESVVLFADGARRAARQVGQELGISQIEPLDSESEIVAGAADVVVIVGADQAQ